jgi:hypothetical protein
MLAIAKDPKDVDPDVVFLPDSALHAMATISALEVQFSYGKYDIQVKAQFDHNEQPNRWALLAFVEKTIHIKKELVAENGIENLQAPFISEFIEKGELSSTVYNVFAYVLFPMLTTPHD